MRPPKTIATRMPLPAFAVADPTAPKMPVPIIIPAVISVAVLRPSVRASDVLDSGFPDCCPDTTWTSIGSLLIFKSPSPSPSHKGCQTRNCLLSRQYLLRNRRSIKPLLTHVFLHSPLDCGQLPENFRKLIDVKVQA